jgi:hypothetical protein
MEKAAEKRKRREARKLGIDEAEPEAVEEEPLDPNDPYYLAKLFAREQGE